MRSRLVMFLTIAVFFHICLPTLVGQDYANWSLEEAKMIGRAMIKSGHVAGASSLRVYATNKAISYQFRASWLTPSVIKATARLEQLGRRLSNPETEKLVEAAENAGDTVFLIELNAIEGSGVIPEDWQAFLQPANLPAGSDACISGEKAHELRKIPALAGVLEKDYTYDRFWVVFSLLCRDGQPLFRQGTKNAELIVRVNNKEAIVAFAIPADVIEKSERLGRQLGK